ncbi:translesion error-prone DNA polymerase V autoproteolytic subunit [Neptunomonas japonica]|uniref:DNA polymerase V subunit UmuD n=1 Tax=Neptunomonas japonica JAMM 1380 TaxID=1441457 RepID=A0A7R6P9W7_9GAMM|nr:translesion error-prone DNA polymerase V autoproteolytic subunit [Neptunomonas japonica]BBB29943.1 DNA polymerase V subunit UmuD [Neptunomonas japonica JAMM 1380]
MLTTLLGRFSQQQNHAIPLFQDSVAAGFPSPAQDYIEKTLDLNDLCIKHPAATFFVRAEGNSMIDAGIFSGDILVVDRSLTARSSDIVIACIHDEFTVKQLIISSTSVQLRPMNKAYSTITLHEGNELEVFGVVTTVIHSLRG